jgi:cobalt/nickel transport system permease protein
VFELFSDIFAGRDNALRRIDARAKLAVAALAILLCLFSWRAAFPLLVAISCLVTTAVIGVPMSLTLKRLLFPLLAALFVLLLKLFMIGSTEIFTVQLDGIVLIARAEGLSQGITIVARVVGAVSVVMLLGFSTPAHELFSALRWMRAPEEIVDLALLMYRHIFTLIEQAGEVAVAQRVRLGYAGLARTLSSAGTLAGTVILRSLEQSVRTHEAMMARCYGGRLSFAPARPLQPKDRVWALVAALVVLTAFWMLGGGVI